MNKISASIMCLDPLYFKDNIDVLLKHKIDYLHIDIMDGHFVPNLGLGLDFIKKVRDYTPTPFDFHIMCKNPDNIIPLLGAKANDIITIHYESTFQIQRTLELAYKYVDLVFIALNPATPVVSIEEIIHFIKGVNLLTVNPGFAGQRIVESSFRKAQKLANFIKENNCNNFTFQVDGNISLENAKILADIGANNFVAGTSSIFNRKLINENALCELKEILKIT